MAGRGKKPPKGGRSKIKRAAKVAVDGPPLEEIADPWTGFRSPLGGKLSPPEEWKRLQDPASRGRQLALTEHAAQAVLQASTPEALRSAVCATAGQASTGDTPDDAAGGGNDASKGDADDKISVERLILRGSNLPLATSVCARQQLVTGLISLDVSGTQLGDADLDKVAAWTPWLRELYAAENALSRVSFLGNLKKLQSLDLAHNSISSLPHCCFPHELGPTLRRLSLESNRLNRLDVSATDEPDSAQAAGLKHQTVASVPASSSSLTSPLHVLTSLVDLNLAHNELGAQDGDGRRVLETFTKAGFPRLASLDLRSNFPVEGELEDELLRITTRLQTLQTLNGEAVSRTAMVHSSKQPMFELLSTGEQCAKEGRREEESCSCLEGNPCAVAYHCRDWPNRFEVAAAATAATRGGSISKP